MGLQDVRRGYRRSVLGPFWLTISLAVTVAALSLLYGQLLGVPLARYAPHVALGFIVWQFIAGVVAASCSVFVRPGVDHERPPAAVAVRAHRHVGQPAGDGAQRAGVRRGGDSQIVPGLALVLLNAVWVGLLLGTLCARFRDVQPIVASVMRIAFFLTPVMWMPEMLGSRAHLALYNPFAYFVELIRAPLLGQAVPALTWMLVLGVTATGWAAAWAVFARYRGRVPYWL